MSTVVMVMTSACQSCSLFAKRSIKKRKKNEEEQKETQRVKEVKGELGDKQLMSERKTSCYLQLHK